MRQPFQVLSFVSALTRLTAAASLLGFLSLLAGLPVLAAEPATGPRRIGVIFVVHGGSEDQDAAQTFDSTLQFFQYDTNNVIFKSLIWNPKAWPGVLKQGDSQSYANAATQLKKYAFASERIGGRDPAPLVTEQQFESMSRELDRLAPELGVEFVTDVAQWIGTQEQTFRLPWPRWMYGPQVAGGSPLTYCGGATDGGPWPDCNPGRYDLDGPAERLLKRGATALVMVDMTVGGVRFWKTFDVISMTRRFVADWNARNNTRVPVYWINDPADLMLASLPQDPPNWTRSLGPPKADARVPLAGRPNPVVEDPLLVAMNVDGIVRSFNPKVPPARTAVMFINHAIRDGNETFDPKIDDTLVLDGLIKAELLRRYPDMQADNIIGSWMGIKEANAAAPGPPGRAPKERTRAMRGEDLGSAWLYESNRQLPGGDHGYRYWEALDLLRQRRDVQHIVVIFSQIVTDSALNLVEVPNQIGKEIGTATWLYAKSGDRRRYPATGHPFADYWGVWVETQCRVVDGGADREVVGPCCFTLGGCKDGQPYPAPRQAPANRIMEDTDPSLAFDLPAWGHLGYDPALGPPSARKPVQQQYRGTWAMWEPANDDPRMGQLLARQVAQFLQESPAMARTAAR
jgi:hypothetical protein